MLVATFCGDVSIVIFCKSIIQLVQAFLLGRKMSLFIFCTTARSDNINVGIDLGLSSQQLFLRILNGNKITIR